MRLLTLRDYASAVRLLEAAGKHNLESLFLLAFSYDTFGLDKPDAAWRCFEEIIVQYPSSPWVKVARENSGENEVRHDEKKLREMALTRFDRNHDGVLDDAEKRAAAKDPAYATAQASLTDKQEQLNMARIAWRYDADGNGRLDPAELETIYRLNRHLSALRESPNACRPLTCSRRYSRRSFPPPRTC
jgi:hypothetical protein